MNNQQGASSLGQISLAIRAASDRSAESVQAPFDGSSAFNFSNVADEGIGMSEWPTEVPSPEPLVVDPVRETDINPTTNRSDAPQSSPIALLTAEDLAKRDAEAVAYTKGLLHEGDTMVFVTPPGNTKYFGPSGFPILDTPHIIHSSRVVATGSEKLSKMFGDWQQHRIRGRKKIRSILPQGIKYVLDLSPPEEGDEAVELTATLSCSVGICEWHTSGERCHIANALVGGQEEYYTAETLMGPQTNNEDRSIVEPTDPNSNEDERNRFARTSETAQGNVAQAEELGVQSGPGATKVIQLRVVPEYDPARHRAGIVRLLQVIEGVDPRLDSAPKVWTLYALAQYFDCASVVTDWIVAWLMAEPNTQFIEILPEVSCKIGFGLKNYMITRSAFSILVSEEALSIISRGLGKHDADLKHQSQFGRLKGDVDEDLKTRLEYASRSFAERIKKSFDDLTAESMQWFGNLVEFQKLERFERHIETIPHHHLATSWLHAVYAMKEALRHYIRRRIFTVLESDLPSSFVLEANKRRTAENSSNTYRRTFSYTYKNLVAEERFMTRYFWELLLDLKFDISSEYSGNTKHTNNKSCPLRSNSAHVKFVSVNNLRATKNRVNRAIFEAIEHNCYNEGLFPVDCQQVDGARTHIGEAGVTYFDDPRSVNSPPPKDGQSTDWWQALDNETSSRGNHIAMAISGSGSGRIDAGECLPLIPKQLLLAESPHLRNKAAPFSRYTLSNLDLAAETTYQQDPVGSPTRKYDVPADWAIKTSSLFFSLKDFMEDACSEIGRHCANMLSTSEVGFRLEVTDTLLCMGSEEFKFLPLWAGGDDDGSGGVFDEDIPPAFMGPIGPGPSFHTGQSNMSAVSSEVNFGTGSDTMSFHTSVGVEDGYTDHLDRRRVVSDDGFRSETFSEDSEIYDAPDIIEFTDKGKGIDHNQHPTYKPRHRPGESSVALSETSSDATLDCAMSASDNSIVDVMPGVDTLDGGNDATMVHDEAEDDDMWDASDTEYFDFGDD